ncbi:MAG: ABC transporter permease [Clostridia bacterium]|nr:ABC transporter permease [Clostridia bacterium]
MFIFIMIVFPIVLIWLLGNAFSGIMNDSGSSVMHASMIYTLEDDSEASKSFKTYMVDAKTDTFTFYEQKDREKALDGIRKNTYDAYVIVSENQIEIYKNSVYNFNGSMAELIISSFVDRYNMTLEVLNIDPMSMANQNNTVTGFTKVIPVNKTREPGSMDYYGVTITSMFIFYGLIFISTYIIGDQRQKTRDRVLIAKVNTATYQWGIITGNVVILLLQMLLLIFLGIFVFNTYWGDHLLVPVLILTGELIMVSSFGALLGILIKSESVVAGISQLVIPIFVFLGDGYTPLPSSGIFGIIKQFSPIYWVNHSIFNAIYLNDYHNACISITISLSVALLCTLVIIMKQKNRRKVHA